MMRRALLALALLVAAAARAQEFDVFDFNDFVDPRLHGVIFKNNGVQGRDNGDWLTITRLTSGGIANYEWRNNPTGARVVFANLVTSSYLGLTQANFKVTTLHDFDGDNGRSFLPRYRFTTQLARYFVINSHRDAGPFTLDQLAGRLLLSASLEENRFARTALRPGGPPPGQTPDATLSPSAVTLHKRRLNSELGAELDLSIPLPHGAVANGSLVIVSRDMGDLGRTHRVTYFYRLEDRTLNDRIRISTSLGVGGEKSKEWHWGALRAGFIGAVKLGKRATLNAAWTPTYQPGARNHRVFHEVALFVDRTLHVSIRPPVSR
jgi:hypothetical protein